MKSILRSCVSCNDNEIVVQLEGMFHVLSNREVEYLECMVQSYYSVGETPTEAHMIAKFPELQGLLKDAPILKGRDLEFHIKNFVNTRKNQQTSLDLMNLASKVDGKGLTEEDVEALREKVQTSSKGLQENSYNFSSYRDLYKVQKSLPSGMRTFVKTFDDMTGGMTPGTINTIMAHVGQYKSTWGLNIAYNNAYHLGFNIAVISLEVPKDLMMWNLLSRHSKNEFFDKYDFVPHHKMRFHTLNEEEEEYVMNDVLDDFEKNSQGHVFLLDETDFVNLSYGEIRDTLYKIDDKCMELNGEHLDGILIDHIGLFKYSNGDSKAKDEYGMINNYVSFFRKLSLKFRRLENGEYTKLTTIMLVQANRKGFDEAVKKKGQYSLLAVAEANEVERSSYRVYSIFTDDVLKESKEALVCLLKNRGGQTCFTPMPVFAEGASYTFGDVKQGESSSGVDLEANIMDSIDFDDVFGDSDLGLFS